MEKIVRDNKPDEGGPTLIRMASLDADHAVAADPERYSIESAKPVLPPPTLEQRVARLELRVDAMGQPAALPAVSHEPTDEELDADRQQAEAENQGKTE